MTSTTFRPFLLALTLSISACASLQAPPNDTDLRLQAANHFFGGRYEYLIIHSAGQFADGLFLRTTQLTGPSQMARDLATRLAVAEKTKLRIMVSGADPQKTLDVIRKAFAFHASSHLPGLELLFLGEPNDESTVRKLVTSVGGVMRFAPFES